MGNDSSIARVVEHFSAVLDRSPAGARLPSSRTVAAELGVSPVTVQRALDELVGRGLVETRTGVGAFAAPRRAVVHADTDWQDVALGPSRIDSAALASVLDGAQTAGLQMGAGYLDRSLRSDDRLAQATSRAARRPGVWDRPPVRGVAELRTWFGAQTGAEADDVLITPAAQGALSAILRAVARPGDPVLFATPAYPGALAIARSAGLVPVSVPTDEHGVRPELAERAFAQSGATVFYLQPTYANPDATVLAAERRAELLDIAHRHGAVLVEDDFARWLGHGDAVPPPLLTDDRHGHVVTICSLTKVAAPSMRVGAVIARGPLAARITDMRTVDDFFVAAPLQYAAVELVSSPSWKPHLRALGAALAARRAALNSALAAALPEGCRATTPRGGVSIWLQLPPGVSDLDVARQAAQRQVFVHPGRYYTLVTPPQAHLRLSFAALPESDAQEGASRLADAIDAARG